MRAGRNDSLSLGVPTDLIEAIAERTAERLAERMPDRPEPYLDVDGAAEYLACQPHRIYDLCRQGLPCHKDGKRSLFRRQDLDEWLSKSDPA
jgi:excisionase family DNA binding protein